MQRCKPTRRSFRTRIEHQKAIVEAIEREPAMLQMGVASDLGKRDVYYKSWKELTVKLNSMGFGQKTTEKWQRAVTDWVSKVKIKFTKNWKKLAKRPPNIPLPSANAGLSDLEIRILALKGIDCGNILTKATAMENSYNSNVNKEIVPISRVVEQEYEEEFTDLAPEIVKEEVYDEELEVKNSAFDATEFFYENCNEDSYICEPAVKRGQIIVEDESHESIPDTNDSIQKETLQTLKSINGNLCRLTAAVEEVVQFMIKK